MRDPDPLERIVEAVEATFVAFRRDNPSLGIDQLLDMMRTIRGGFAEPTELAVFEVMRLLWCSSGEDAEDLKRRWADIQASQSSFDSKSGSDTETSDPDSPTLDPEAGPRPSSDPNETPQNASRQEKERDLKTKDQPSAGVDLDQSPERATGYKTIGTDLPEARDRALEAATSGPIRSDGMIHAWRKFRRTARVGVPNVLDLTETVRKIADQGFYLEPVYRRRTRNEAQLLVLMDQEGSMAPFHWLTRELLDTAASDGRIETVRTLYFHDCFHRHVFERSALLGPIEFDRVLTEFSPRCGILIVSDAGAARGSLDVEERIIPTLRMLAKIRRHTANTAWVNPMPLRRWEGTSAQYIAQAVPMFPLTPEGLTKAVARLQGLASGGVN